MKNQWKDKSLEYRRFLERRYRLQEDKTHLINRLNLTDEQKNTLITFFKNHPNYESKVDWNNKNLTFEDFSELLALEGNTKSSKKKYGLSGKAQIEDLVLDKDYKVLAQTEDYIIYYPLNFKASEVLAKPTTPPEGVTGKWCISGKNYSPGTQDQHWNSYVTRGIDFFFVFLKTTKWAVARYPSDGPAQGQVEIFNQDDTAMDGWTDICEPDLPYKSLFHDQQMEIRKVCEDSPHLLEGQMFKEDKDGNRWSLDLKELVKVNDNLPVLKVPEGTSLIKWRAANHRTQLQYLTIPDGVRLEDEAFAYCWGLKEIKLGKNITVGPADAPFTKARGHVTFAEGTTEIPQYIFADSNISDITIPESVFKIGSSAFMCCGLLESITLPKGLDQIGMWAFGSTRIREFKLPVGLDFLGEYAFSGNQCITEMDIPGSVWLVRNGLFQDCSELRKVKLGWGIERIGMNAFANCYLLKTLYLPGTLEFINPGAFGRSYYSPNRLKLDKIYFSGTEKQFFTLTNDPELNFLRESSIVYTDQNYNEVQQ